MKMTAYLRKLRRESVQSQLRGILQQTEEHCAAQPQTYEDLHHQRSYADVALIVALQTICEVLPTELQPTVKRLLALRDAMWKREVKVDEHEQDSISSEWRGEA